MIFKNTNLFYVFIKAESDCKRNITLIQNQTKKYKDKVPDHFLVGMFDHLDSISLLGEKLKFINSEIINN